MISSWVLREVREGFWLVLVSGNMGGFPAKGIFVLVVIFLQDEAVAGSFGDV